MHNLNNQCSPGIVTRCRTVCGHGAGELVARQQENRWNPEERALAGFYS